MAGRAVWTALVETQALVTWPRRPVRYSRSESRSGAAEPESPGRVHKNRTDRVIGSALMLGDEPQERYQVLTIRDGKIVDMQGCRSKREAERFARRHN